ncbi:MAG: hypothetical protein R2862_12065 [Thermoanaerobaculia bacterium]
MNLPQNAMNFPLRSSNRRSSTARLTRRQNCCGTATVIGHEIEASASSVIAASRRFRGRLANWWTEDDSAGSRSSPPAWWRRRRRRAASRSAPHRQAHFVRENIADRFAGVSAAYDGYRAEGKSPTPESQLQGRRRPALLPLVRPDRR